MGYSGNHPRFSRKEEMIHDRELIYDAKQQLHRADKAYKESPAHKMDPMHNGKPGVQKDDFAQFSGSKAPTNYGTEHSSPVAMTDAASYRSKMAKHWSASNSRFDMPIMHDEAGRKGEGSPNMMVSPLNKEQGYNDRLDESLAKDGKEKSKQQSTKARRDESKGMEKAKGKQAYSSDSKMDDAKRKGNKAARASRSSKMASIKEGEAAKEAKLNKQKPKK